VVYAAYGAGLMLVGAALAGLALWERRPKQRRGGAQPQEAAR
jgi:hypothetical protein